MSFEAMVGQPRETVSTANIAYTEKRPFKAGKGRPASGDNRVFFLGTLLDDRLSLVFPLKVKTQKAEGYLAICEELGEFGYGPDSGEAIKGLQLCIAETYWQLEKHQGSLGPGMVKLWALMSQAIKRVSR